MATVDFTNKAFFAEINRRSSKTAERVTTDMKDRMLAILRNRRSLGNGANYPRWFPTSKEPHPSLKSFSFWGATASESSPHKIYWTFHNKAISKKGFNYPSVLVTGEGYPKRWRDTVRRGKTLKGEPTKLVELGTLIFSKQMPRGLEPWMMMKRDQLKDELEEALSPKNRKRY